MGKRPWRLLKLSLLLLIGFAQNIVKVVESCDEHFRRPERAGKTLLVCSHEWGEGLNRYYRLLLLTHRVLANDTPPSVVTMDNIQQAYGANI